MSRSVEVWGLVVVALAMLLGAGCAKKSVPVSGASTQMGATSPSEEEIRAREEAERRRRIAESQLAARPTTPAAGSTVMDNVYFGFDESTLSDQARDTLVRDADWLRANPNARVQVEGNCDERGTAEYNLALGQRRADAVKSYLTSLGIAANRLTTISYGKERPADPGHDEEAWAKNRRVEFRVM